LRRSKALATVEKALGETIPTIEEVQQKLKAAEEQHGSSSFH
jgi:hypothetical protein